MITAKTTTNRRDIERYIRVTMLVNAPPNKFIVGSW